MKGQNTKINRFINSISIRKKTIISYILILSAAIVSVAAVLIAMFSVKYEKQLLYSSSQSCTQAKEFLEYRANSVQYASNLLQVDNELQEILTRSESEVADDYILQNKDMMYMENYIYSLCNSTDIFQISLYVPNYFMYVDQEVLFRNLDTFEKTVEYDKLKNSKKSGIWLPTEKIYSADTSKWVEVISFLREIKDVSDLTRTIGVQRVSIKYDDIYSILKNSKITKNGLVCLISGDEELIGATDEKQYQLMKGEFIKYKNNYINGSVWEKIKVDGKKYYINNTPINSTDWSLIVAVPESELFNDFLSLVTGMIGVIFLIFLLAIAISVVFSKMITTRISELAAKMENFKKTDFENIEDDVKDMGNDEIGSLFVSFNNMKNEIDRLIEAEYENGKSVKQAELKALQAQINPHFLYNTLDLINWKALDCGAESIVDISKALAKFYRLSLNKGKEFSKLSEEFDHVKYYVAIQNYRFENRIKLSFDIDERINDLISLHIILQPLVENCIVHGMKDMSEEENIYITVSGKLIDNDVELIVEDSGCGVDVEAMNESLLKDFDKDGGYGVKNINARIKLCYGEKYGLHYMENSFGGTSVRIIIPKVTGDE
ncbi:MAG: HAMP domain-containing protein [Lachnospiraceae bacterium]|nr:HAMP domain-containing protein [Lachnospiraceae bacterium]